MKKITGISFLTLAGLLLMTQIASGFPIANNGVAQCDIVYAADQFGTDETAVEELKTYLERITGANFQLVAESMDDPQTPSIYVGWTNFAAGSGVDFTTFTEEEYCIKTVGNNLIIGGGLARGTLNGVYHFLTRELGCRFFAWDCEVITASPTLELQTLDIRREPSFVGRAIYLPTTGFGYTTEGTAKLNDHLRRNYYNRYESAYDRPSTSVNATTFHNSFFWVSPLLYFDTHPEYFSNDEFNDPIPIDGRNQEGQLCWTNPAVWNIVLQKMRSVIQQDRANLPEWQWPTVYQLSQNDINLPCQCTNCQSELARLGSLSAVLLQFVNYVATNIALDYPDVKIMTFAYNNTADAPANITPAANVIIQWCDSYDLSDCYRPLTSEFNVSQKARLDEWENLGASLALWDYWNMGIAREIGPYFNPPRVETMVDAIAPDLRYFAASGVKIAMIEAEFSHRTPQNFVDLQYYVGLQLMADISLNEATLISEFMTGYFGPAASYMTQFLTTLRTAIANEEEPLFYVTNPNRAYTDGTFLENVYVLLHNALATVPVGSDYYRRVQQEMITPLEVILLNPRYGVSQRISVTRDELLREYRDARMSRIDQPWVTVDRREEDLAVLDQDLASLSFVTEEGLVSYWMFNEDSGDVAKDSVIMKNDGSIYGATRTENGKFGGSLIFDTGELVDCGNDASLRSDNYTVTGWIKPTTSLDISRRIIYNGKSGDDNGYLLQLWSDGSLYAYQAVNGDFGAVSVNTPFPNDGAYHHIAMAFSYDGTNSTMNLYVDGVLKVTRTTVGAPDLPESSRHFYIGGGNFTGEIDEIRLYSRALSAAEINQQFIEGDIRGYWRFEKGEAHDYSPFGNHGTLVMDPDTCWVDGKFGDGLLFDTGELVNCGNDASLRSSNYTVTGWIKPTTNLAIGRRIIYNGSSSGNNGYLLQLWSDGYLYAYQAVNGDFGAVSVNTPFPNDGAYHHIAMAFSYDGTNSTLKLYVDGVLKVTRMAVGAPDLPESSRNFYIGGQNFTGGIDEIRLYSRALSAAEINQQFLEDEIRGHWCFDEGEGNVAHDSSPFGNHDEFMYHMSLDTCWVNGKFGGGLRFDEGDYLDCGNNASLHPSSYTITGWIKPTTNLVTHRRIIYNGDIGDANGYLLQLWDDGNLYAYQAVNGNFYAVSISTPFPNDGAYHHVAMTFSYDGTNSTMKLYVDGNPRVTRTATGTPDLPESSHNFLVGGRNFTGEMDDIRVYSRVLSENEVYQNFLEGS